MILRLDTRERYTLVIGGVFLFCVLFWLFVLSPYFAAMQAFDRRLDGSRRNLERVEMVRLEISQLRQQLATVETQQRARRPLFAQVENLTKEMAVHDQLLAMRPQPESMQDGFRQQLVELRLERVSLVQLVRFLHAAEYRSNGIQVRSLRVRPRFDDRSRLDVNLVLMSLERV